MNSTKTSDPAASGEDDAYRRARRRVHKLRGFYGSAFIYLVIVGMLTVLNLLTDASYLWVGWVALFWGVGIAFHAYSTFIGQGPFGRRWEERKIREFMDRERRPDRPGGTTHQ